MDNQGSLINSLSEEIARARKSHRMYYNGKSGSGDQDYVDDQIRELASRIRELSRIRLELEELFTATWPNPRSNYHVRKRIPEEVPILFQAR